MVSCLQFMVDQIGQIPQELIPLFEAKTAHESLSAAISLIKGSSQDKQVTLLRNTIFQKAVLNALQGLDECNKDHSQTIIDSFATKNREEALQLILDK